MSHLLDFETQVTSQEALIRALCRMGFTREQVEIHDKATRINGYHTDENKVGNIIIRQSNTKIPSDIGWELGKTGSYVEHVDDYQYWNTDKHYNTEWKSKLYTYYNVELSRMELDAKGIQYKESKDTKGRIQIEAMFEVKDEEQIRIRL